MRPNVPGSTLVPMDLTARALPTAGIRRLKHEANHRLLGDTIQISDDAWEGPSLLPGWTRAHVAAHLARNAEGFKAVVQGVTAGRIVPMYVSESERMWSIERGSEKSPLQLQIDLDTSMSELSAALDGLRSDQWDFLVRFDGELIPVGLILLSRLSEVVLHHIDLNVGFGLDDIDADTAVWVMRWCLHRLMEVPPTTSYWVETPTDGAVLVGQPMPHPPVVSGSVVDLLGWMSGRDPHRAHTSQLEFHPHRIL